jgi:hypothetical protein
MLNLPGVRRIGLFASQSGAAIALLAACSGGGSQAPTPTLLPETSAVSQRLQTRRALDPVYRQVVLTTQPIAYFPLDSVSEGSIVNGYTTSFIGGAKIVTGGPIHDQSMDRSASLSGKTQYVTTSLSGDIPGTGSMVAWVNLAALPGSTGHFFYVSGESQLSNDLDLQFEVDNAVHFYTGAGEQTSYAPPVSSLVGHWNMIAVTYQGGASGFRDVYWDGALTAPFSGNVNAASKTTQFSMGESLFFTGRYFQGRIDDVAVWNRALTAGEIRRIYNASK